jgi:hypothetical protein
MGIITTVQSGYDKRATEKILGAIKSMRLTRSVWLDGTSRSWRYCKFVRSYQLDMQSSKGNFRRAPIDTNLRTCWLCHDESRRSSISTIYMGRLYVRLMGRFEEGLISKESRIGVFQVVYHAVDMLRSTSHAASHQVMSCEWHVWCNLQQWRLWRKKIMLNCC